MRRSKANKVNTFDYESYVQKALRTVVHDVLKQVGEQGLPGSHHFYITFQTNRSDVQIPDFLRKKHPEEVTIVLQHQFWDLKITNEGFHVGLSFDNVQEMIYVPFTAVISFLDPSVRFGLQFVPDEEMQQDQRPGKPAKPQEKEALEAPTTSNNVVSFDAYRKK
jgi:hypothetical protein